MALSRDAVLSAEDRKLMEVDVPEWGGSVFLRVMTGAERDSFEQSIVGSKGQDSNLDNMRAKLLVRTICDESGKRLFGDKDFRDLGDKSGAVLTMLFTKAQAINAMGQKELDEKEKNSESEAKDISLSASQES